MEGESQYFMQTIHPIVSNVFFKCVDFIFPEKIPAILAILAILVVSDPMRFGSARIVEVSNGWFKLPEPLFRQCISHQDASKMGYLEKLGILFEIPVGECSVR